MRKRMEGNSGGGGGAPQTDNSEVLVIAFYVTNHLRCLVQLTAELKSAQDKIGVLHTNLKVHAAG